MLSTDYLMSDDFLATAKKSFDIVLLEKEHTDKHSIQSVLLHHLQHEKNILLCLEHSSLETILPLTTHSKANITIINPSSGILGFAHKGFWDQGDISKALSFGFEVFEPAFQEDITHLLSKPSKKRYIRISEHTPIRDDLPPLQYIDNSEDIFTLQPYGFSGSHGTIITLGNNCVDTIHATVALQEKGKGMDVFVSRNCSLQFTKTLQESIQRTENLIIIMDQHPGSLYESYIKAKLWETGLYETDIQFITPDYKNITTIFPEYIYEQAKFDGANIAERIS